MIPLSKSLNFITSQSGIIPDTLQMYLNIENRLKGIDNHPYGSAWNAGEDSIDVLESLLTSESPKEIKDTVILVWEHISIKVLEWISNPNKTKNDPEYKWCINLAMLAEISSCKDFKNYIYLMLNTFFYIDNKDFHEPIFYLVSAWEDYPKSESDMELTEKIINDPRYDGFGLRILVKFDPNHEKIEGYLYNIWVNYFSNKTLTCPIFLSLSLKRYINNDLIIKVLYKIINNESKYLIDKIENLFESEKDEKIKYWWISAKQM